MRYIARIICLANDFVKDFDYILKNNLTKKEKEEKMDFILEKYNEIFTYYNINTQKRKGSSLLFFRTCCNIYEASRKMCE